MTIKRKKTERGKLKKLAHVTGQKSTGYIYLLLEIHRLETRGRCSNIHVLAFSATPHFNRFFEFRVNKN